MNRDNVIHNMDSIGVEKLTVSDLKTDAQIMEPDTTISKVIGVMKKEEIYQVYSKINDKIGMISMRDLLKVTNITTRKTSSTITYVPKIKPEQGIRDVATIMERYRVRALPVVEDNEIIGEINSTSIVNAMNRDSLKKFKIKSIMTRSPIVLNSKDLATKAKKIMTQKRIDHIPVTENGKLTGVITSSQIVFRMLPSQSVETGALGADKENRLDFSLKMILDAVPVTCEVEANILDVLESIQKHKSTYSTALFWDEVQGIVTYRDFLKLIASEKTKLDIPVYLVGLPDDPFEAESTRDKFLKTVSGLKKTYPEIIEARSIIKTKEIRKDRRRYEVKTLLKTKMKTYSYSEGGYDLPTIYDAISKRMKRLMTQKKLKSRRSSSRRLPE